MIFGVILMSANRLRHYNLRLWLNSYMYSWWKLFYQLVKFHYMCRCTDVCNFKCLKKHTYWEKHKSILYSLFWCKMLEVWRGQRHGPPFHTYAHNKQKCKRLLHENLDTCKVLSINWSSYTSTGGENRLHINWY